MKHYHDGRFVEMLHLDPFDRGWLYGDGVFTTVLVDEGAPHLVDEHLAQLHEQCTRAGISYALPREAIIELIELNGAGSGTYRLRIMVTGGVMRSLALPKRQGSVIMSMSPYKPPEGAIVALGEYPHPIEVPHGNMKSMAHLSRLYVQQWADERGFDDAITQSKEGYLMETAFSNLFWVDLEGAVFTPSFALPLYPGVMLQHYLKDKKVVHQVKVREIPEEADLYICNALQGVRLATKKEKGQLH